ncbi:MAG: CHAT domain-containing tetratricopeptide repeat protein [Elainellaceae cyanobacterium]
MNHFWEQAIAFEFYGNYREAIDHFQRSLRIARTQGDNGAEATLLANLGALYGAEGDYERAVETYRAGFQVARRHNLSEAEAHLNLNLASAYLVQGNMDGAEFLLTDTLAMARNLGDRLLEAQVLSNLGTVQYNYGQYNDAIAYHRQAVAIAQEVGDRRLQGQTLNNLGHILFRTEQLDEAEAALRSAISNFEQTRPIHHDSYNISTFDTQILTYRLLEQVLVAKGDLGNALVASEEGRARAFIDLLSQRNTSPPLASSQLSPILNTDPSLDQIRRIARERDATIVQYSIISDPDFRFQGRQRGPNAELWIWVVQPDGTIEHQAVNLTDTDLQALVRDGRQSIGAYMRGDRTTHSIQVGDRVRRIGEPLSWQPYHVVAVNLDTGLLTLEHPDFEVPAPVPIAEIDVELLQQPESILPRLQALHHVLIQPIQDVLPQNPNDLVIFIPTEELFLVPFAALQAPDGSYLIEHHTITTSPSIQVLDFTAQRQHELSQLNPAQRADALVVGNPSSMPNQLDSLPYAEEEAKAIAQMLNTRPLIGAEATETEVRQRLETARIIHFATHGLFNETTPLQGAIAFSPDHEHDGLLTAEELLGHSLQAELVVLSACETGQGEITGDGVLGLSRSLLASGTPSALVSLWQVPDNTTAILMTSFYQYQRTEPTYAHALRQAMLSTLRQNPHPHQWAAFTLLGEAGQIRQSNIPPKK